MYHFIRTLGVCGLGIVALGSLPIDDRKVAKHSFKPTGTFSYSKILATYRQLAVPSAP
jgi:hypothetical protein